MSKKLGFKGIKANNNETAFIKDNSNSFDSNSSKNRLTKDIPIYSSKTRDYNDFGNIVEDDKPTKISTVYIKNFNGLKGKSSSQKVNYKEFFEFIFWVILLVIVIIGKKQGLTEPKNQEQKYLAEYEKSIKQIKEFEKRLKDLPPLPLNVNKPNNKYGYNFDYKKIKNLDLSTVDNRNNNLIIKIPANEKDELVEPKNSEQ